MSNGTHGVEDIKMQKKKRKKPMTRSWVDLCSNDVTLDGFTVKERVSVSRSLGYTMTAISKYFTLEEMTKKDRYVLDGSCSCSCSCISGLCTQSVSFLFQNV